jgi:hypothetical protein
MIPAHESIVSLGLSHLPFLEVTTITIQIKETLTAAWGLIHCKSNLVQFVRTPEEDTDAATKKYVDDTVVNSIRTHNYDVYFEEVQSRSAARITVMRTKSLTHPNNMIFDVGVFHLRLLPLTSDTFPDGLIISNVRTWVTVTKAGLVQASDSTKFEGVHPQEGYPQVFELHQVIPMDLKVFQEWGVVLVKVVIS